MFKSFPMRVAGLVLVLAVAAGCSSKKAAIYEHENFDDSGTFSRNYPVADTASCEAARRALLSQGYIITSSDPKLISGHKSFQQTGETHMEISFSVVCAEDGSAGHHATVFANALQDKYALKKTNNSASLGVGVLGSVSMPIGSSDDSMVKVASETVTSAKFYERFFALVELFLPKEVKEAAHITEKPKTDLGVPEPKAAPAPLAPQTAAEPAPAADAAQAPVEATPVASEPVAPPPEAAPITAAPSAEPTPSPEAITPPANPTDIPPPSEPIQAMPITGQ
jgi:cell division septation protein DedD